MSRQRLAPGPIMPAGTTETRKSEATPQSGWSGPRNETEKQRQVDDIPCRWRAWANPSPEEGRREEEWSSP